jgi:hypothetical protein
MKNLNHKWVIEIYSYKNKFTEEDDFLFREIQINPAGCDSRLTQVSFPYNAYIFEYDLQKDTNSNQEPDRSWMNESGIAGNIKLLIREELLFDELKVKFEKESARKLSPYALYALQSFFLKDIARKVRLESQLIKSLIQKKVNDNLPQKEKNLIKLQEDILLDKVFLENTLDDMEFPEKYLSPDYIEEYNLILESKKTKSSIELLLERVNSVLEIYSIKVDRLTDKKHFLWEMIAEWTIVIIILMEFILAYIEFLKGH